MKKSIVLLTLLITTLFTCFAATKTPVFEQRTDNLIVNLASDYFMNHTTNVSWGGTTATKNSEAKYYYQNQTLGLVGIFADNTASNARITEDVTITAELTSGKWFYIYEGTDERYMMPFGIYLCGRGKTEQSFASGSTHYDIPGCSLYLGADTTTGEVKGSVTMKAGTKGKSGNTTATKDFFGVWWDIILVFPNNVDTTNDTVKGPNNTTYKLLPSEKLYNASIKITISCGTTSQTYEVPLSGYYKSNTTYNTKSICLLNVSKYATANSVDIKSLYTSGTSSKASIAKYSLTTSTEKYSSGKPTEKTLGYINLVLSSSSKLTGTASEEFTLRHVNANGTTSLRDTNYNSIKYRAYLTSDITGTSVEFDGKGTYSNSTISGNKLVINPSIQQGQDGTYQYRWYDIGEISVAIPNDPSIQTINGQEIKLDNLQAGQYTSNIYIHVITDIYT
ncbi:MAG: hypothetical protein HUK24_00710 [Sphaerochaetaceae bacterium]|nr:hypothetical protein [Sphaerochaetaceae bacterium]